jgi:hypothetical protein
MQYLASTRSVRKMAFGASLTEGVWALEQGKSNTSADIWHFTTMSMLFHITIILKTALPPRLIADLMSLSAY